MKKYLAMMMVSLAAMAAGSRVQAQCCITLLPPTNTATITISSPFGLTADFSAANNPAVFSDQVTVGNPAVPPGTYLGWCVDVVDDIGNGPSSYDTTMYSSCDPNLNNELPAGYPASVYASPANWHAVNYILNHKNGAYFWNIQYALWYFVGGPAPTGLGPPAYPESDPNEINALINDAISNAPAWQSQCGDVVAVVVSVSVLPHDQLTIIEVPCCSVNFVKCPVSVDLGCNPKNIPDCTGTVDTNVVNAVSCCGRPVSITCSKSESTVNCKTYRTLTYTAMDDMGHSAICQQTIIWSTDTTAPVLSSVPAGTNYGCTNVTLPTDASVKALVSATETCSTPTINVTHVDVTINCVTTRTFTITATDACGNTSAPKTVVYSYGCACGTPIAHGDTATIGFWHNKNGQALINCQKPDTALASWLASNFPYLYGANAPAGNNLTGKNDAAVAALFMTFFGQSGQKTDAQIMAGALATYVTTTSLGGTTGTKYGFNVSAGGTGNKTYNVGSNGSIVGLSNNTSYTVLQLLQQVNLLKKQGLFTSTVATAFNDIFNGINQGGDIN